MSGLPPLMIVTAARVLCKRGADQCNVDFNDSWKQYADDYIADAEAMLTACGAPELLEALKTLLFTADDSPAYDAAIVQARAAIAKATGEQQ